MVDDCDQPSVEEHSTPISVSLNPKVNRPYDLLLIEELRSDEMIVYSFQRTPKLYALRKTNFEILMAIKIAVVHQHIEICLTLTEPIRAL